MTLINIQYYIIYVTNNIIKYWIEYTGEVYLVFVTPPPPPQTKTKKNIYINFIIQAIYHPGLKPGNKEENKNKA